MGISKLTHRDRHTHVLVYIDTLVTRLFNMQMTFSISTSNDYMCLDQSSTTTIYDNIRNFTVDSNLCWCVVAVVFMNLMNVV